MKIIDLSQNDTKESIADKCNINFKEIGSSIAKMVKQLQSSKSNTAVPPVDSYEMNYINPASLYPGTSWVEVGLVSVRPLDPDSLSPGVSMYLWVRES